MSAFGPRYQLLFHLTLFKKFQNYIFAFELLSAALTSVGIMQVREMALVLPNVNLIFSI